MLDETNKNSIDLREYWQIFLRRKLFFILPLIITTIGGVILCLVTDPVYESSTVVRVSRSQLLSPEMERMLPGVTAQDQLNNLRRLITSHSYLKRLISTLNLLNDPHMIKKANSQKNKYPGVPLNEITELLWLNQLKSFLVIRQLGADYIQITAYGNTAEMAHNFAKTLTQIFIDESLRSEVGGIRGALAFSHEQLNIYKQKLESAEEDLRRFQEGMVRDEFEVQAIASTNLEQVNSSLSSTEFELREAHDRLNWLRMQTNGTRLKQTVSQTRSIRILKTQLLNAVLELSKLMLKNSWQDVKVLKINDEIENLRGLIRNEIEAEIKTQSNLRNDSKIDIIVQKEITEMDVEFLNRKKEMLSNLVQYYRSSIAKGPSREMTLSRLQREVEANRQIYQSLLAQTRGSEIEEALQRTVAEFKFKIVEPAMKPIQPIEPDRIKIMLMAIALGFGIGIGIIVLLEYTDHSFKKVDDIENMVNLPVLGIISKIEMDPNQKFIKIK